MSNFDVILSMDCLSTFRVQIDCFAKTITFQLSGLSGVVVATTKGNAFMEALIAHIKCEASKSFVASLLVVPEFQDIFEEIPRCFTSISGMRTK